MLSLVYVSRSLIAPTERLRVLDDLMAVSIARNTSLDITGLLITTDDYFAQLLEGPAAGVDAVMTSILADPRHTDVRIMRRGHVEQQRCMRWRMSRFDGQNFGNAGIAQLCDAAHQQSAPDAARRLDRLIEAIALNSTPRKI